MQCKNLHPLASTQPQLRRWQPWLLAGCFLSTSVAGLEGADPLASSSSRSHPITDAIGIQFLSSQPMSLLNTSGKPNARSDSAINFRIHDEAVVDRKLQASRPMAAPLAPPRALNVAPQGNPAVAPTQTPVKPPETARSEIKTVEGRSAERLEQRQPERYRPKAMVVSVESKEDLTGKTESVVAEPTARDARTPALAMPPAPTTTAPLLVVDAEQLQQSLDRVATDAAPAAASPLASEDPLMKALRQATRSYTDPPGALRSSSPAILSPPSTAPKTNDNLSPTPAESRRSLPELAKLEPVTAPAGLQTAPAKKTATGETSGIELTEAVAEPEIEWNKYPAAIQTLRLTPREVRNLRLNRPVARLEMVRKNKVQAVLRSPMDLTLLGVQEGTTLIVFHPVDPQAAPWSLAFQVGRPGFSSGSSTTDLELVQQSIQACYPNSEVTLRQGEQGELVVEGTVASESVARDILSMVRQLCLVPVQDEIVSQSK